MNSYVLGDKMNYINDSQSYRIRTNGSFVQFEDY